MLDFRVHGHIFSTGRARGTVLLSRDESSQAFPDSSNVSACAIETRTGRPGTEATSIYRDSASVESTRGGSLTLAPMSRSEIEAAID